MYLVKITVQASNPKATNTRYRKMLIEGLFAEKAESKLTVQQVEEQVIARLRPQLEKSDPELIFELSATAQRLPDDFIILEKD